MTTVLCVHQGTEKYGSDKSFVSAVACLERHAEYKTEILLPGKGAISELIETARLSPPRIRPLWVLRKAGFVKAMTLGLPRNLWAVAVAARDLRRFDIVYVNTAVILDFLLASILTRRRLTVHVREIPIGFAMRVIRALLMAAKADVIFNSRATKDAFALSAQQKQSVVYNGFEAPADVAKAPYDGARKLRILCIGRLNAWKGQEVLVRACALQPDTMKSKVAVRIVGGVYKDQTHFRTGLKDEIAQSGLADVVEICDFVDDPSQEYVDADIVVVPSTLPEPFGRVAIEGMAFGCAVIAADHGGLSEIVVGDKTGRLIPPNDPQALAEALQCYLNALDLAREHGTAGRARFENMFTQEASDAQLLEAFACP